MANPLMGTFGNTATGAALAVSQMPDINAIRQVTQSAKRMMGMLQTVKNPQQALMQVAQQNPQLNATLQMIGGRNPQDVFYEECQKHGINPDDVINLLRN